MAQEVDPCGERTLGECSKLLVCFIYISAFAGQPIFPTGSECRIKNCKKREREQKSNMKYLDFRCQQSFQQSSQLMRTKSLDY